MIAPQVIETRLTEGAAKARLIALCARLRGGLPMQASILHFDEFELDLNSYELRKSGRLVRLEKLPMELLILLAENQGQLVTREQIIQRLWGDNVFVYTRQGINTAVRKIRVAMQDDPENPRVLETVTGRGYRFLTPVSTEGNTPHQPTRQVPSLPSSPPTLSAPLASTAPSPLWRYAFAAGVMLAALAVVYLLVSHRGAVSLPVEQRITANPPEAPVRFALISPDGKYIAFSDATGLYLRQISSGETRPLGVPRDFIAHPNSWFPDGTHLLMTRFEGVGRTPSLWKLSILGGSPLKLMDDAAGGAVSPDGSRIAYLAGPALGTELWLMTRMGQDPERSRRQPLPIGLFQGEAGFGRSYGLPTANDLPTSRPTEPSLRTQPRTATRCGRWTPTGATSRWC